jgi:hypothetical protein
LTEFLHRFGRETEIATYSGSAESFVAELHRRWTERHPGIGGGASAAAPDLPHPGSIFISYGRENLPAVERLCNAITLLGGDVWFDRNELGAGDQWEKKILPQIQREVRLFVPVISARTAERQEGYVFREWREALERSKKIVGRTFIAPIVVDTDYEGDLGRYGSLLDEFPAFQDLDFGRAPGGEPDARLRQSLVAQIRAMRREEAR